VANGRVGGAPLAVDQGGGCSFYAWESSGRPAGWVGSEVKCEFGEEGFHGVVRQVPARRVGCS